MRWLVSERDTAGRIREYTSDDGRWRLWDQPFTPVWHVYYDGRFVQDVLGVRAARSWVETYRDDIDAMLVTYDAQQSLAK